MSDGHRFDRDLAIEAAQRVIELLGLRDAEIVGSVRRGRETVGDVELIAPLPKDGARDAVFHQASEVLRMPPGAVGMFAEAEQARVTYGQVVQGLNEHFRALRLLLDGPCVPIQVEIYRYVPGHLGNYGWVKMIRTGPSELSAELLARWKRARGGDIEGSREGFPIDAGGRPIPVPDEERAFRLCQTNYIEPEQRDEWAMRHARRSERVSAAVGA